MLPIPCGFFQKKIYKIWLHTCWENAGQARLPVFEATACGTKTPKVPDTFRFWITFWDLHRKGWNSGILLPISGGFFQIKNCKIWLSICWENAGQARPSVLTLLTRSPRHGLEGISQQGSHSESSFSAKTLPFQLSLDFFNREWYRLQHIEKLQESIKPLAGIQKLNSVNSENSCSSSKLLNSRQKFHEFL